MALKETVTSMKQLLGDISKDLFKSTSGNKAASQRVRTKTIVLEKIAKKFRKESVASEKKGLKKKTPAAAIKNTLARAARKNKP